MSSSVRPTWVIHCLLLLALVALAVVTIAFFTGRLRYAEIREDTGAFRTCVLGFPASGGTAPEDPLSRALAAVARIPPRIPPRWHVVETEPELSSPESNPRYAWAAAYSGAAAWTQVDLRIARYLVQDLADWLRKNPREVPRLSTTVLSTLPSGPLEASGTRIRYEVLPGWLRLEEVRPYLNQIGYFEGPGTDAGAALGLNGFTDIGRPVIDDAGWTPLHLAALLGDAGYTAELLEAGARVNAPNVAGYRPLHLAAQLGHVRSMRVLLSHGARPDARAGGGWSPLVCAAANGWKSAADMLLSEGADVNLADDRGRTALHFCAWRGLPVLVKELLDSGAAPNLKNKDGATPLDLALAAGHQNVAELLREHGAKRAGRPAEPAMTNGEL